MPTRTENFLIVGLHAALLFVICAGVFYLLAQLATSEPFGHDEAVYLTKARSWYTELPADQWGMYRPVGMSVVGWVLLQFSHAEGFVRIFGLLAGALTCGTIFLFFRSVSNLWTAIATTVLVASSFLFLQQAPLFFNDVASSGLLVALMWVVYLYYESHGQSNAIYWAAPIAALAFYLRYGAIQAIAIIAICSAVLILRKFLYQKEADFRKLGITVFITALLFLPHFIYSAVQTKELLGVLTSAGEAAQRKYLGEGLVQYLSWLPDRLAGWPIEFAAVIGIAVLIALITVKEWRDKYAVFVWVGTIGLGTFFLTGLLVHAETRYVFFPLVLLAGLGVAGTHALIKKISLYLANITLLAVCVAAVFFGVQYFNTLDAYYRERENSTLSHAYSAVHEAVRLSSERAGGCSLWVVQFQPRASWYTGCNIYDTPTPTSFKTNFDEYSSHGPLYSIVATKMRAPQLNEDRAQEYGVVLNEIYRVRNLSTLGDLIVYRIVNLRKDKVKFSTTNIVSS